MANSDFGKLEVSLDGMPRVVLAGGEAKPELEAVIGTKNRAMAIVLGKPLLRHVVDALLEANPHSPITVVGNQPNSPDYQVLKDCGGFVPNVMAGVSEHASANLVLIATADLPFLKGDSVRAITLMAQKVATDTGAEAIFPIVPVATCYRQFPGIKRTSVKLKEGEFTGGNLMFVVPKSLLKQEKRIGELYEARKSPLKLAGILGYGVLARLIFSRLSLSAPPELQVLEEIFSKVVGVKAKAIVCDFPDIATDLDRPSDFRALKPE